MPEKTLFRAEELCHLTRCSGISRLYATIAVNPHLPLVLLKRTEACYQSPEGRLSCGNRIEASLQPKASGKLLYC